MRQALVALVWASSVALAFWAGTTTRGWQPASSSVHSTLLSQQTGGVEQTDADAARLPGRTLLQRHHSRATHGDDARGQGGHGSRSFVYAGPGFYVRPGHQDAPHGSLLSTAWKDAGEGGVTDKFTTHAYETVYGRLFELAPGRHRMHKMLEIGLGCNMGEGQAVGASARMWRRYFPHAEIWFAEFDAKCVTVRQKELEALGIKVVTGDQEDPATLKRWIQETGGNFDLIIDDGGHTNAQQYQSLMHLFPSALRPGGAYVLEDLTWSKGTRSGACGPKPPGTCEVMADVITQWVDQLMLRRCDRMWPEGRESVFMPKPDPFHYMLPGIRSIECAPEACVFIKCFADDQKCVYPGCVDMAQAALSLWNSSYANIPPLGR